MNHTDEMLSKATIIIADFGVPDDEAGELAFLVLKAALADVPEPGEFVDNDAFYASVADDLSELEAEDPKIKALGDKVREAEQALVDSVRSKAGYEGCVYQDLERAQKRIAELEALLHNVGEVACDSISRTMEERIDRIQDLLSGNPEGT